ncbi:transposase, partial [Streptococcus sp. WM07]
MKKKKLLFKKTLIYPVETETITYKRKKTKGRKQAILDQFEAEEI